MRETIIEKVRSAGVVGAGGAGFPTHVKLDARVDTVLVNGASCEPLLESDPVLMEMETNAMMEGLKAVIDCTGAEKGIVCLKGKHGKAVKAMRKAIADDTSGRLAIHELDDFYPAGDEHVLVNVVLGRTVPEAGIPLAVGALVSNVESLINIARALDDHPVTDRYLTVAGEVAQPMVVKVPVGTPVSQVLAFAGGPLIDDYRVVDGGPMMGRVLPDTDQPVTKTTSGLIVLAPTHNVVAGKIKDPEAIRRITASVCCQCTHCTELCPRFLLGHSLHPHILMRSLVSGAADEQVVKEALLCSECGICEKFACPMLISPREVNMQLKARLMKAGTRWQPADTPPVNSAFFSLRKIPTQRLMQRLDVARYDTHPGLTPASIVPDRVHLPLNQHIGAPAQPCVAPGDTVQKGDLVAEIPEDALGARLHASIDGQVTDVTDRSITIAHHPAHY